MCGELAGDPAAAVLLAGLGVTELSMAPALIAEAKAALRAVDLADARAAAHAALDAEDADARAPARRWPCSERAQRSMTTFSALVSAARPNVS